MAAGGTTTLVNLLKVKSNDLLVGNGVTGTGSLRVTIASDNSAINVNAAQPTASGSIATIAGVTGQLTVAATTLYVGQTVTVAGTNSGSGSITNGTYRISVTNGSTSLTLVNLDGTAISTTAGTPVGLTYSTYTPGIISNLSMMAGQTIAMGTGVRTAGTQRVTIATDDIVPASQSGTWNINTVTSVTSITNALPAGTNAIGKLAANDGVDIGDVTINNAIGSGAYVRLTDGTNTMPTMDAAARAGFHKITDGTNTASVIATINSLKSDISSVGGTAVVTGGVNGTIGVGGVAASGTATASAGNPLLAGAIATTAAPTYTTATSNPLSLTTGGSLRVDVISALPAGTNAIGKLAANSGVTIGAVEIAATQTLSTVSTVTSVTQFNGTAISMKAASTAAVASDTSLVVALSPNTGLPTGSNSIGTVGLNAGSNSIGTVGLNAGTNAIGKLTANDGVDIGDVTVNNAIGSGVYVRLTDGTNTMPTGDAAARGIYHRLTDGTNAATVKAASTAAATADTALVVSFAGANSATKIGDGTNNAAIKAASTAAAATDPSLVVAFSPNTGLPTGTNSIGNIGTVSTVTSLTQFNGNAIATNTGVRSAGTLRVSVATDDVVQTKATPDATGTYSGTNATTSAYATNLVVKATAGTLYMLSGYNSLASAQFIQVHNATSLPADTSVPAVMFYVPPTSNFCFDFGVYGRYFSTGIVVCNSTTGPTKTVGAANCWFDAQYK